MLHGLLKTEGIRTAKRLFIENPKVLLASWLEYYSLAKKCKLRTYRSGFSSKQEMLLRLQKSDLSQFVSLALHSAAEARGCKNTNLDTLELYMLDPQIRMDLEELLQLEPQERGYEVLLIEPYYKRLLERGVHAEVGIKIAPDLLTFLDLFNFPLRGQEQAEYMAERLPGLKRIYGKS